MSLHFHERNVLIIHSNCKDETVAFCVVKFCLFIKPFRFYNIILPKSIIAESEEKNKIKIFKLAADWTFEKARHLINWRKLSSVLAYSLLKWLQQMQMVIDVDIRISIITVLLVVESFEKEILKLFHYFLVVKIMYIHRLEVHCCLTHFTLFKTKWNWKTFYYTGVQEVTVIIDANWKTISSNDFSWQSRLIMKILT